jgi:hypothetical protein
MQPKGARRVPTVMQRFTPAFLAVLACALAAAPGASATGTKDLWATVNVCDTARAPNEMGVRARMPGDGRRRLMYMRFSAQFKSGKSWKAVSGKGASRWLYAGSALFKTQELGYTFSFDAPPKGASYLMRGLVQFQWRSKRGKVVRRTHLHTAGHHRTRGADPKGFSAATCRISTPR